MYNGLFNINKKIRVRWEVRHFQNCENLLWKSFSWTKKRILGQKKAADPLSECYSSLFKNYAYYFQISIRKMWCMS